MCVRYDSLRDKDKRNPELDSKGLKRLRTAASIGAHPTYIVLHGRVRNTLSDLPEAFIIIVGVASNAFFRRSSGKHSNKNTAKKSRDFKINVKQDAGMTREKLENPLHSMRELSRPLDGSGYSRYDLAICPRFAEHQSASVPSSC